MKASKSRLSAALAAVTLWATNAYAADFALDRMALGWLLLVQYGTAATALLAVSSISRARGRAVASKPGESSPGKAGGRLPPALMLLGVVGLTGTIFLQYLAFALAPIVAANVLAYSWPLLAAAWVAATVHTRQTLLSVGLALVGFAGVALISTSPARGATEGSADEHVMWGYLAGLGSAGCMAVYTLGAGRIGTTTRTSLLIPATLAGAAAAAVLTVLSGSPAPSATGVAAAVYIGLGPMAAGYALWTQAMANAGVERLSPLGYATPLLSTTLLLATGAPATTVTLVGVGLVLACSIGVLAHDRHTSRQPRDRPVTVAAAGCEGRSAVKTQPLEDLVNDSPCGWPRHLEFPYPQVCEAVESRPEHDRDERGVAAGSRTGVEAPLNGRDLS